MKFPYRLPQDLLIDIFVRLSSKSLLRFQCLSKSWKSLITSLFFINTQLNHNTLLSQNEHSLLLTRFFFMAMHCSLKTEIRNYCNVIASCNGIICLWDTPGMKNIVSWNPSIRKIFKLAPSALSRREHGCSSDTVAFGFDSKSNDY